MNKILIFLTVITVSLVVQSAYAVELEQFTLRVRSEPNVLFIGGGGIYKEGTIVTVDKAPDIWQDYRFVGWQIDGRWVKENPPKIQMNSNHDLAAMYTKNDLATVTIDAIPRAAEVTVDDKIYLPSELPLTLSLTLGKTITVAFDEFVDSDPNTRYVFDTWKDQKGESERTITLDGDVSLTALYKTQFQLKTISEYGTIHGGGWWDKGSTIEFGIDDTAVFDKDNEQIRYVFDGWDKGDYRSSETNSIDIEAPTTVVANWKQQYKLDLVSAVPGVSIYGSGWYNLGKTVAIIAEEEYESPEANAKYVFDRWESVGPNTIIIPNPKSPLTTVTMDAPYYLEAKYKKSYLVNVYTPFGTTTGGGFYPEGSNAEIKITSAEVIAEPNKVKKVFAGWDAGDNKIVNTIPGKPSLEGGPTTNQNLVITVEKPTTIIAKWKDQYYLDVKSDESKAAGSGWYDSGQVVPISVSAPLTPPGAWSTHAFAGWSGDYEGKTVKGMVLVNKPKMVMAEWRDDYTPGAINAIILAGVGSVGMMIFNKTKKKAPLSAMAKPYSKKFARDVLSAGMVILNKTRKRLTSRNYDEPDSKYNKNYDDKNNPYMKSESFDNHVGASFDDKNDPTYKRSSRHSPAGIA